MNAIMLKKELQNISISDISFVLFLLFSFLLAGCGTGSNGGAGTMTVEMTDAPIDSADAVNVNIESVEVQSQNGSGWITLNKPQKTYDLLELVNGATEVIGTTELEAGTYSQIRLILGDSGHSVVVDGKPYEMKVPGGPQTGVKLNVNAEIKPDIEYVLLLDFDASRSVVEAGQAVNTAKYLLQPVIEAKEKAITGNIAGTVNPADAEPVVYALAGNDTLSTTLADTSSGDFKLIGLEEGSYDVSVEPRNNNFQSKTVNSVSVTAGKTNDIDPIDLQ
ncbi:protein of unknown function (DUF4382) [Fodinibius salinus]|uniref:DUF4382 domain-containing protein n=1 Tax=Fodinibius salinus TaxID=860790 RepID=A0A5D3YQE5_9BACT|nr:DUF4382 domain-containing protein [Fodinibius salinus]TYP95269.1 protein of unknown function (DUF4382) [Fodinibius salinus]